MVHNARGRYIYTFYIRKMLKITAKIGRVSCIKHFAFVSSVLTHSCVRRREKTRFLFHYIYISPPPTHTHIRRLQTSYTANRLFMVFRRNTQRSSKTDVSKYNNSLPTKIITKTIKYNKR